MNNVEEIVMADISKEMARLAYEALDDKKAVDIKVISIGDISIIADYFIIANGNNAPQVTALVDNVQEVLGRKGYEPKRIEGIRTSNWVLMDYGDIVVHIFSEEDRLFYDLERIWRDGKIVNKEELDDK